ncbi:MAG: Gfo/Idh/MocA family protein [Cyclobacteriaceae bacterium]
MKKKQAPSDSRRSFLKHSLASLATISIVPSYVLGGSRHVAPSDKFNLAYIGTGKQGRGTLLRKFIEIPEIQITAACDVDKEKLADFVQKASEHYAAQKEQSSYQGISTFEDFREMLKRPDIDGVIVATPDHWHALASIAAADAGKHVYCEKPLSLTVREGRAMVEAARRNNIVFQTGSMQRSWDDFHRAAELVYNGYIGDIQQVVVSVGDPPDACEQPDEPTPAALNWDMWLGPAPDRGYSSFFAPPISWDGWPRWRYCKNYGGGMMTDWGAHMFDIAQWALGMDNSGPVEVIPPDGKDYPVLTYRYANGIPMVREDFGKGNAIKFVGSEGTIEVSREFLNLPDKLVGQSITQQDKHLYKSYDHYRDWLHGIRRGEKPICDVEVGHRTATVCNIGNIAYELNRPLKWDPEKEEFVKDKEANKHLSRKMRKPWSV